MKFIVELGPGVWLADGDGDPPRTLWIGNAKRYLTEHGAKGALARARKHRPFKSAKILPCHA